LREPSRSTGFDAVRLIAALGVLFTHAYATRGVLLEEPVWQTIPGILNAATAAVCCFFAISGYLVTQSFVQRADHWRGLRDFILARVLRIFPAFIVCLLCAMALGAVITTLTFVDYLLHADTWRYLYANVLLQNFNTLPGVFATNPNGAGVNGSIWTIPLEVGMYGATLLFGMLQAWRGRWPAVAAVVVLLLWCLLAPRWFVFFPHDGHTVAYLVMCYAVGVLWAVWRVRQRDTFVLLLTMVIVFLVLFNAEVNLDVSRVFAALAVALGALWIGRMRFAPLGWAKQFGDLSYGVFLYSSLIQQTLIWRFPEISLVALLLWSAILSLIAALVSWHLIEKRALRLKRG
jgi:peptidoglycan/LPS O-acetylase OafA/YrhL